MISERRIEDILKEEGVFVSTTVGVSMYPMLRNRRDTIIVRPYEGRLKKYDVPLYRKGELYVLHRIIDVRPDSYVICGDNCEQIEYGITDDQIIGVLTGFYRGSKQIDMESWGYRMYARYWGKTLSLRRLRGRILRTASKVWRYIKKGARR